MKTKTAYINYRNEAQQYFVTKFIDVKKRGDKDVLVLGMVKKIMKALEVILNLKKNPVKKGLCLYSGAFGQGKTMFFDIVFHRANRLRGVKLFKKISAKELRRIYTEEGIKAVEELLTVKSIFVDDIGEEEGKATHFGDGLEVVRYVILRRYELWIEKGYTFNFTTNIITSDNNGKPNFSEIVNRYDARVADRLKEMCEFIDFEFLKDGASFRQVKSTRRLSESEKKKEPEKKEYFDFAKHELEYLKHMNDLAEEYRMGKLNNHWHDFKLMFDFLKGKNVQFRKETEEDKQKAIALLRDDEKHDKKGRSIDILKVKSEYLKNNVLHIENAIKSVICKEYFIKLAKENFAFDETKNFPKL